MDAELIRVLSQILDIMSSSPHWVNIQTVEGAGVATKLRNSLTPDPFI